MFQLYTTRIKILMREKSSLFWTLFFPIILSIFFFVVLNNAYSSHAIDTINIAIVSQVEEEGTGYTQFTEMMKQVSISENKKMFNITFTNSKNAKDLLDKNKITGYVLYDNGLNLVVKESGLYESITKSVLETYSKVTNTINNIYVLNGELISNAEIETLYQGGDYIINSNAINNPPDLVLNHYYSLIAMACLFGAMYGLKEVCDIQANLSAKGARLNASPVNKVKLALSSIMAAFTIQLTSILLLIAFLAFVLHVDFGDRILLIIITSIIGSLTGVLIGTSIGSISKKSEDFKSSLISSVSMLCCFLAGLMVVNMKYIIASKVPFLQYINPANLITDAFYSLYFYSSLNRFYVNISILCIINVILMIITFNSTRRTEYASI